MFLKITGPDDVAAAFRDAMKQQVEAVLVGGDQVVNLLSAQISTAANVGLRDRAPNVALPRRGGR